MRYALVTGAYGGMGRAAALALRDAGWFVFALDRKTGEPEDRIFPIESDVTEEESLRKAAETVRGITDTLHAVCHFAGIYVLDSLVEMEEEKFTRAFDVNVFGVYRVNREFLPLLRRGSRILITTSELAPLDPLPFTGLYGITKSALDKYAFSLRMELQLLGIDVVVLRPGAVKTGLLDVSTAELQRFCGNTKLYSCNAKRFRAIVEAVEARHIPPEAVAKKALRILGAKHPRYVYAMNRNPLLLLMHLLPKRLQTWAIRLVLK